MRSPLDSIDPQDPEILILANFAPGKEPQANHETLKDVQKLAIERIGKAKMIEIIGVHLPTNSLDDPIFCTVWRLVLVSYSVQADAAAPPQKPADPSWTGAGFRSHG